MTAPYINIHHVAHIKSELREFEPTEHNPKGMVTVIITAYNGQDEKILDLTLFGKDKESMQIYGWSAK